MSKTEEVNELLKKLPLAPAGVERWVHEQIIENAYIIFDNTQGKAVCTRCGKQFSMKHIIGVDHNIKTHCPKCGTSAIYKANRYGRKKLTEYFRVLLLTHRGKTVYGTLFEVTAEFEPFGKPVLSKWLSALYVFKENEQHYYKHHPGWYFGSEYWEEIGRVNLPCPPRGAFYCSAKFERTELYPGNLENVFTKSCLKYHYDRDFFENYKISSYEMIQYISQSLKYPAIELLRKAGFGRLVKDRLNDRGYKGTINIRGKNLKAILRLPRRWHKKVKEMDMSNAQLHAFHSLNEEERAYATQELLDQYIRAAWLRKDIEPFVPFGEALRYVNDQESFISFYKDYLEAVHAIGADMTSKAVLFPQDLRQEHDRATSMRKVQEDERSKRAMLDTVEKLKKKFQAYQDSELFIRVAESQQELNDESKALSHCVRTYGEKMAKGSTIIFFIRRIDEPDTPYYTLELSPKNEMLQCRGNRNCNMTDDVKAFVDKWLEHIKKEPKKEKEAA